MKLQRDFYLSNDVVQISRDLLGKILCTRFDSILTSGIIMETEAYAGITDRASHAYGERRTQRTEVMYAQGGTAYVYLCYGIHHLFNVVTNVRNVPHAVLIRAIKPLEGMETILWRRNLTLPPEGEFRKRKKNIPFWKKISGGPGTVSQALGIFTLHSGTDLLGNKIWIEERGIKVSEKNIKAGPRVGVDYAGKDARLPYRFMLKAD